MIISAVVAFGENFAIGFKNQLLWHLKGDLPRFKKLTLGKTVIMGRKTFESIGKPLSGRENIVMSRTLSSIPGVRVVQTTEEALKIAGSDEVFVIGGEEIYKLFFPKIDKIYLTKVYDSPMGDAFFPKINWNDFNIELEQKIENHDPCFDYLILTRK